MTSIYNLEPNPMQVYSDATLTMINGAYTQVSVVGRIVAPEPNPPFPPLTVCQKGACCTEQGESRLLAATTAACSRQAQARHNTTSIR